MDVPSRPGDPLAQPTRARLFARLDELRRPASTQELAAHLGRHPNGVRVHLERLREAGLVTRRREPLARGRPRDTWAIAPGARPGGDPPTSYAELARWLVRSLVAEHVGARDVEVAGRRIGRELASGGAEAASLTDMLAAMGFQPRFERLTGDRVTYCLCNCPYRDAVRERPTLVCGLHRGVTRGMLDTLDPKTKLVGFVPSDPDAAGCLIELRGRMAADAARR